MDDANGGATPRLVVDAMNVIGSRPDGWWRDREGAARTLLGRLARLSEADGVGVTVVLDGRPLPDVPASDRDDLQVLYARRPGRDAADDRIVELVASERDPTSLVVVTSDRALGARVAALGASVRGARWLLDQLDAVERPSTR